MFKRFSKKALDGLFALVVVLGLSLAAHAQNGIVQKISFYLDGTVHQASEYNRSRRR